MKIGIMFDDGTELSKHIPVNFIAETWCNYSSFWSLPLSARHRLLPMGYDITDYEECKHLIERAKKWALITGYPQNYVMDFKEQMLWKKLEVITALVANV